MKWCASWLSKRKSNDKRVGSEKTGFIAESMSRAFFKIIRHCIRLFASLRQKLFFQEVIDPEEKLEHHINSCPAGRLLLARGIHAQPYSRFITTMSKTLHCAAQMSRPLLRAVIQPCLTEQSGDGPSIECPPRPHPVKAPAHSPRRQPRDT